MVMEDFGGKIPMTVNELMKLPGVGRKTANVITSVVDNQPNMAVIRMYSGLPIELDS